MGGPAIAQQVCSKPEGANLSSLERGAIDSCYGASGAVIALVHLPLVYGPDQPGGGRRAKSGEEGLGTQFLAPTSALQDPGVSCVNPEEVWSGCGYHGKAIYLTVDRPREIRFRRGHP